MLYDFKCLQCNHTFEELINENDYYPECEKCHGKTMKILSIPANYMGTATARMNRIASKYKGMKDYLP
jgi:putative FmdB family regulatory protein